MTKIYLPKVSIKKWNKVDSTCAWRGRLTHAGRIAVGIRGLLTELLLCAAIILVGILLVLDENFPQEVHGTGQRTSCFQLKSEVCQYLLDINDTN